MAGNSREAKEVNIEVASETNAVAAFWPTQNAEYASISGAPTVAAWGTAVFTAVWANNVSGPWIPFVSTEASALTFGPGTSGIGRLYVAGKAFFGVRVSTGEGASEKVTLQAWTDEDRQARR